MSLLRSARFGTIRGLRPYPIASSFAPVRQYGQRFSTATTMAGTPERHFARPMIFVCDMQEKFRNAIWKFDKIVLTAQKVLRAAEILHIPVIATTQNAAKLGPTVAELEALIPGSAVQADKTAFSMLRAEGVPRAMRGPACDIAIVGIESHICVTQTALDLAARGDRVYVLADAVSSCNPEELPLALARLRAADRVTVTSSEAWLYECMGDAAIPQFRDVARLVKETSAQTREVLGEMLSKM
ncbi:Isochorismatase hydrolase [Hypoxylon sp. FL1284]|nr:Isochorismatase hydrolase [Hypoxylon sp. FL1284]